MPPSTKKQKQKDAEQRVLQATCLIYPHFPTGKVYQFEEPDFKIETANGWLGVEVTKLVRPQEENGFGPIETESFHKRVVELAERYYYESGAPLVDVNVCFLDEKRSKQENPTGWLWLTDKRTGSKAEKMASSLSEFVKTHWPAASGVTTFKQRCELPVGFEVITIASPLRGSWYSGESGSMRPLVYQDLAAKIEEKNHRLDKYRANLLSCPIWLIIYSGPSIAEGIPIPCIENWTFSFAFDRVLLFSGMDNRVCEIKRS